MNWLEIASWLAAALLLAGLHVWTPRHRVLRPSGVFVGALLGAVLGGVFAHVMLLEPFVAGSYSLWGLVTALIFAEVSILMALAIRGGERPPLAGG
jgi:hypothetical protein